MVIKPHLLERSKIGRSEPTIDTSSYDGTIDTVFISAGNPGDYCCSRNSPINEAFYDGELQGSNIDVNEYITSSPFVKGFCNCRRYQVFTNSIFGFSYVDCNGVLKQGSTGPTVVPVNIETCNTSSIDTIFTGYTATEQGSWQDNQPYEEPYGGWNSLDNNVSSSLLSQYKFKEIKQGFKINPDNICGTCALYEFEITQLDLLLGQASFQYIDCTTGLLSTRTFTNLGFGQINSCVQPVTLTGDFNINFAGRVPQFIPNPSYFVSTSFQDSYLTDTSFMRSRYTGVNTTSPNFNLPTIGDVIPNNTNNVGSLSNAEQEITYMAFADWAGNSLAENFGSSNYHIKYLIDETGSVFKPEYSSSYYWNTDQSFGADTPVNIAQYNGSGSIGQDYETTIYRPLKRFNVVVHTESGSIGNFLTSSRIPISMSFSPTDINSTLPTKTIPISNGVLVRTSPNILVASPSFSMVYYSSSFIESYSQNQQGSGFSTPLPLEIKPGDELRINPNTFYTIISSSVDITNINNPSLQIFLDRSIPFGSYFTWSIRRLVDDPGFIIINNDPENISQTGLAPSFIIPKYASKTLKNNLNDIIQNLSAKNLI
jgi:hypothetical protein